MPKKLDYSAAWADATALLRAHREGVVAIAGFFLFAVTWAGAFLVPDPGLEGTETLSEIAALLRTHFAANWTVIVPVTLIGSYGGFVIYVLMMRHNLLKVGDALTGALKQFLPYFIASLLAGWLTLLGFAAFLVPGFYLVARFIMLPAVMASDPQAGIIDSIKASWAATAGVGWATFFSAVHGSTRDVADFHSGKSGDWVAVCIICRPRWYYARRNRVCCIVLDSTGRDFHRTDCGDLPPVAAAGS